MSLPTFIAESPFDTMQTQRLYREPVTRPVYRPRYQYTRRVSAR